MSAQSLREALAEQLYGEVWSGKSWSGATSQEKALCYKAAQRFEQIIAEHVPRPLLDREAVLGAVRDEFNDYPEGLSFVTALDGGILPVSQVAALAADAVMELARPMPTREQIAKAIAHARDEHGQFMLEGYEVYDGIQNDLADAVLALLNGAEA